MADLWQFRRDSSANWTASNPILADGEMGLEVDTRQYKIGTGVTAWTALPYGGINGADGKDGQIRFTGYGAPVTVIGSQPNDTYLDLNTGDIYKLT